MTQKWDYIAKIVSLGDSGCGKSSLTIRLCEGRFTQQHDVTIGVEFGSRIVPVARSRDAALDSLGVNEPWTISPAAPVPAATTDRSAPKVEGEAAKHNQKRQEQQKYMKLSIWDTAGQETYKSITRSYFRGASGALLVFDITRRNTFESVTSWLADLRQIADDEIVVVLVGNKSDLAPDSIVSSSFEGDGENKRKVTREEAEDWCRQNDVMRYVETSAKSGEGVERAFLEVAERIYQNIEAGKYDLNDRRSGVKSAVAGASGTNSARTVNLGVNDSDTASRVRSGGCC